jgi:hypothetical protein
MKAMMVMPLRGTAATVLMLMMIVFVDYPSKRFSVEHTLQ